VARLAIAKGFLAEYAKLEKDVQRAVETVIAQFAEHAHAVPRLEKVPGSRPAPRCSPRRSQSSDSSVRVVHDTATPRGSSKPASEVTGWEEHAAQPVQRMARRAVVQREPGQSEFPAPARKPVVPAVHLPAAASRARRRATAHAGHLVAEALLGEDLGDAIFSIQVFPRENLTQTSRS
jgi:hypothetical protein